MVVKWANHYSSAQRTLVVGDGDFSFSLCLANAFGSASNVVATSLDSYGMVVKKYGKARSNLKRLRELGATILHEIDATKMKFHADLNTKKFDRIVFNFPHAGFKGIREDRVEMIRQLVDGFFRNASRMLRPFGEVHVRHKIGHPFDKWNIEELASKNFLVLSDRTKFSIDDYPGYRNKRGDGHECDRPFPLGECRTFEFRVGGDNKIKRCKGANNVVGNNLSARTSNSVYHPPSFWDPNARRLHPSIENDALFGHWKHQEDILNESGREWNKILILKYGQGEETVTWDGTIWPIKESKA